MAVPVAVGVRLSLAASVGIPSIEWWTVKSDLVDIEAALRHETDAAYLLDHGGKEPVSATTTFAMPEWLALEKGLI